MKPLADLLNINQFKIMNGTSFREVVKYALVHQYGDLSDLFFAKDSLRKDLEVGVLFSKDFFKFRNPKGDVSNKKIESDVKSIKKGIKESSFEEIVKVSLEIKENVKENSPTIYYDSSVDAYVIVMSQCDRYSQALNFFKRDVGQLLNSEEGFVSLNELFLVLGKDRFYTALHNLPFEERKSMIANKDITKKDIEKLVRKLIRQDKKRNSLHKDILKYAQKNFQKDSLDVFIDFMTKESLSKSNYVCFDSPKKGLLTFRAGILSIPSGGGEFSREYVGKENEDSEGLKNCYEMLKKAREQTFNDRIRYRSLISENRTEEEDNLILNQIEEKFRGYICYKGDFLYKRMHGDMMFSKMIEVDTKKIKAENGYPEKKLEEIKEYITSLIPKTTNGEF